MVRLRIALVALAALAVLAAATRAAGAPSCDISFKPATTGNWSVAANWDLGRVPADGEDVCIPSGSTATLVTGTIRPGAMSVAGTLVWSGGTISGAGTTTIEAGGKIEHTAVTALAEGRVLDVQGTLELKTAGTSIGVIGAAPPAITVAPGGVVKRTATGAGIVTLNPTVANAGSITAESGQLDLAGGGPASTGTFGAAGQAGIVRLSGGTFQLAGAQWLGGVTLGGNGPAANVVSGALTLSGANTLASGTLTGALTVASGTLTWTGGTMKGAGPTTVAPGATLRHAGVTALEDARVLSNQGTLILDAASTYLDGRGTGTSEIRNSGLIRRTATGAGAVSLYPALLNSGTVRADNGPLELRGGSLTPSTGQFGPGTVSGKVRFAAGTWTLAQGADLLGDVEITGATVGVAQGATVPAAGSSRLVSGTLAGTGTLDVTGTLELAGGRMTDAGTTRIAPGGTLVVNGSISITGGRRIENEGLVDVAGDRILSDDLPAPTELLDNRPGGTVRKTAGTGPSPGVLGLPLRNDGTVESLSGVLKVEDGGATPDTGTFRGSSRANRVLLAAGRTLDGDATLEGTVEIGSLIGPVSVVPGETVDGPVDLLRTGGDFSGNLRVTGTMTWSGGRQVGPGTTTIAPGATLRVEGLTASTCAAVKLTSAHRLVNEGRMVFDAGADLFSDSSIPRPRIDNAGSIELDGGAADPCGSQTGFLGDAQVTNTGTIEKTAGTTVAMVRGTLDNDGAIASRAGDLELEGDPAALQTGSFASTGAGSTLTLNDGVFVLGPGAALAGHTVVDEWSELALPAGRTLDVPAGDRLDLIGALSGAGRLRVSGAMTFGGWGGKQAGPGTTQIEPGGTFTVPAGATTSLTADRGLVNRGAASVAGRMAVGSGSAVVNEGTLTLDGTGKLDGAGPYGSGGSGLVHNAGTLVKAGAGEGEVAAPLDNVGTITVEAGTLVARGLLNYGGGGAPGLTGGAFEVGSGTLIVPGPLRANAARLVLDGPASTVVYPDPNGGARRDAVEGLTRNAAGGELVLRGGRSLTVGGAFANHGVLDLGAGSTLEAAAFSQSAGAVLRPAITAGGAGTVATSGAATLGGRLDTPAPATVAGDVTVLTAGAVSGGFAAVSGGYQAVVGATDVTVRRPVGLQRTVAAPVLEAPPAAAPAPAAAPQRPAAARARRCRRARPRSWRWGAWRAAWRPCRARLR